MKIFINQKLIDDYGLSYFVHLDINDFFSDIAYENSVNIDERIYIERDITPDVYIIDEENEDNQRYININWVYLLYYSQYFNMKEICNLAGISYSTYHNWKSELHYLSETKVCLLLKTMKELTKQIHIIE